MIEYIEREALLKNVQTYSMEFGEYIGEDVRDIDAILADMVKDAPAADVAPIVHGRWVEAKVGGMFLYPDGQKMCSVCGQIMPSRWQTMPPFCFGCGAKMNAESEAGK